MPTNSEAAIEFVRPPELTAEVPYAYAATIASPGLVFTAGACPLDRDGNTVAVGDVAGQTRQVMTNLVLTLRASGADLNDVVKTTIYVASDRRRDLSIAWDVVASTFGAHDAPSTLLGVTVLGYPDQLVEVEAIAIRRT